MRRLPVLAFLLLAGCAGLPGFPGLDTGEATVDQVVAEALAATRAPAAEQKSALARAQQAFLQSAVPANRLRLAVLLVTLPAPLRDDARAGELLEPIADPASPGVGRFAALLAGQAAERQRLARELERLGREGDRLHREADRLAKDRERLDRERALADKERDKREEALKQQLEALRAIERGILEREERLRRRQK